MSKKSSLIIKSPIILCTITIVSVSSIIFLVPINTVASLIENYWYIIVVAFFAALIANATAIGGGIIFVPLFIYGLGLPSLSALKLSLATQSFGMSSGAFGWGFKLIDKTTCIVGGSGSLIGFYLGTNLWNVPPEYVKPVFGYMSILIVFALILETRYNNNVTAKSKIQYNGIDLKITGLVIVGIAGGFITSWIAIGVGEFIALYLLFVYRVSIEVAIATGVAILAIDSILGFILHIFLGHIPWDMLIFTIPGVLLGGYIGGKTGKYMDTYLLKLIQNRNYDVFHKISPLRWLIIIIITIDAGIMILV